MFNGTGVSGSRRLEQKAFNFLIGHRSVFYPVWDDEKFPRTQLERSVPKFHPHGPAKRKEEFVFPVMAVPYKFTTELHKLYFLPVQLPHDLRAPVLCDSLEFVGKIDFLHKAIVAKVRRRNNLR